MIRTLSVDVLRTFHAVARLGQFRAAALHLNKTQSAVSMQIQRLEETLGGRLLERDNRGVALTSAGERLLGQVGELLAAHDRIVTSLGQAPLAGRVRFGLPEEYAGPLLRRALPLFAAEHPGAELELETAQSGALREAIDAGRLDLAILVRRAGEGGNGDELLWRTTPAWVGPANASIALEDPLPLALHADRCPYRRAALEALAAAGRCWRAVLTSPSTSAVEASVEAGLALAVVDRSRVTRQMRVLEAMDGLPDLPPHEVVLTRAGDERSQIVAALADQLRRGFRVR